MAKKEPYKIILSGGGTGGHIYPAIAIANELKVRFPDAEFLFVGAERGLEKDLVPKAGYAFRTVRISSFHRSFKPKRQACFRLYGKNKKRAYSL